MVTMLHTKVSIFAEIIEIKPATTQSDLTDSMVEFSSELNEAMKDRQIHDIELTVIPGNEMHYPILFLAVTHSSLKQTLGEEP